MQLLERDSRSINNGFMCAPSRIRVKNKLSISILFFCFHGPVFFPKNRCILVKRGDRKTISMFISSLFVHFAAMFIWRLAFQLAFTRDFLTLHNMGSNFLSEQIKRFLKPLETKYLPGESSRA
jgi:hypothetical protein